MRRGKFSKMDLKTELLSECDRCGHTGVIGTELCECSYRFRALNRMVYTGFNLKTSKLVSGDYHIPEIESGEEYLDYYLDNPEAVEKSGLGLYLYSREKGRGKTTLAHRLVFQVARYFAHTSRYKRDRNYAFERTDRFLADKDSGLWKSSFYVLDDLGAEDGSASWTRKKALSAFQELLHFRRDNQLPTIITSNYEPSDLSRLYDGVLDSLLEISPDGYLGGVMFRQVEIGGGEDFRLSKEESAWPL